MNREDEPDASMLRSPEQFSSPVRFGSFQSETMDGSAALRSPFGGLWSPFDAPFAQSQVLLFRDLDLYEPFVMPPPPESHPSRPINENKLQPFASLETVELCVMRLRERADNTG
jgi:hypothetical protein